MHNMHDSLPQRSLLPLLLVVGRVGHQSVDVSTAFLGIWSRPAFMACMV